MYGRQLHAVFLEYTLRHVINEIFQGNLRIFHFDCGGKQLSWMICLHDLCKVRQDIHTAALHGLKLATTMQLFFFTHRLLTSCFCLFNHLSLRSTVSSAVLLHSTLAVSITSTVTAMKLVSSFSFTMVISVMLPTLLQLLLT